MSLFRSEACQARESAWLGRIVLARPLSFAVLTGAAIAIAAAIGALFTLGDYTRKARVPGTLAPVEGVVRLIAQQAGRVELLRIGEGDHVARGASLATLADARASHGADAATAVANRLRKRLRALERQRAFVLEAANTERRAAERRGEGLRREASQLERETQAQHRRAALAGRGLARSQALEDVGFLSRAARDRQSDALLEQRGKLAAMQRSRLALERELAAIEDEAAAAGARAGAQLAAIDAQRAAIEQELVERPLQYRAEIVAPTDGIIAAVLVQRGQTVHAGATLATLIPAGARLEAHLYAPSRSIGFVRPGQEVLLRYLAYPYQKFGSHRARIVAVSPAPLAPGELGFAPADGSREPVYRIRVELPAQAIAAYGRPHALQAGMQLEADILLDKRRLIEWIFEPLLSLARRA